MVINNRKDIDKLVSNINLNSDMVFFIYSSDRNKIHTLVKEEENKHKIISFDVKYKKEAFLRIETRNSEEEFRKDYKNILIAAKNIGNIKIFDETINAPHYYFNKDENGIVTTTFGWNFEVIKEKKKGTR